MFNFKIRYIAALPPAPPEIRRRLEGFVTYEVGASPSLSNEERDFLATQGLPVVAAPFLSFSADAKGAVQAQGPASAMSTHCFPIGFNGAGDILAIDTSTREVVYFNHDAQNARVFINTSLSQFAECLCIYREHLRNV